MVKFSDTLQDDELMGGAEKYHACCPCIELTVGIHNCIICEFCMSRNSEFPTVRREPYICFKTFDKIYCANNLICFKTKLSVHMEDTAEMLSTILQDYWKAHRQWICLICF